jgi:hypothetical protein
MERSNVGEGEMTGPEAEVSPPVVGAAPRAGAAPGAPLECGDGGAEIGAGARAEDETEVERVDCSEAEMARGLIVAESREPAALAPVTSSVPAKEEKTRPVGSRKSRRPQAVARMSTEGR